MYAIKIYGIILYTTNEIGMYLLMLYHYLNTDLRCKKEQITEPSVSIMLYTKGILDICCECGDLVYT